MGFATRHPWLREVPIIACLVVIVGVLEVYGARYALETASTPLLGWLKAVLMGACAVAVLVGFRRAGMLAEDPRPEVRKRAFGARVVASGFMVLSIFGGAGAFAYERQEREWAVLQSSPTFAEDMAASKNRDLSYQEREEARERIKKPAIAERQFGDVAFPAILHLLAAAAAGSLRAPIPLKRGEAAKILEAAALAAEAKGKDKPQPKKKPSGSVTPFRKKA